MPVKEGNIIPVLAILNKIPLNQTDIGSNVNMDAKVTFEKKCPWQKDNADLNKEDWLDPEVWFSCVVASNMDQEKILGRILHEWKKMTAGVWELKIRKQTTHRVQLCCAACTLRGLRRLL